MIWFTADEHHLHKNIIRHCNRPYSNADVMYRDIVRNVNDCLSSGDTLYHIGDWCWGRPERSGRFYEVMNKYRSDIDHVLILGNHDNLKPFNYIDIGFQSVHTSLTLDYHRIKIIMNHDPSIYQIIENQFDILICGHVHGLFDSLSGKCISVNVGVDVRDFKPISIEEVLDRYWRM